MDDGYSEDDAADGASQDDSAQQPESAPAPVLIGPAEADHIVDEHGWEEGDALPSEAVLRDAVATVAGDGRQDSDAPEGGLLSLSMPSQEVPEPAQGDDRDAQPGGGEEVSGDDDRGDVDDGHEQEEGEDTDDDEAGRDMDRDDFPEGGLVAVGLMAQTAGRKKSTPHDGAAIPRDSQGYPTQLDPVIEREVAAFNKEGGFKPGDEEYMEPGLMKALVRQESGGNMAQYGKDPTQVNRFLKDWDKEKAKLGLEKGARPGQDLSIRAGIRWLAKKAYISDAQGNKTFKGWDFALKKYNGNSKNPDYVEQVRRKQELLDP